jgi:hypothetical protein
MKDHLCFYIWTNNYHSSNSQQENLFKNVKMTMTFWAVFIGKQQDLHYLIVRFNRKGCFVMGWRCY